MNNYILSSTCLDRPKSRHLHEKACQFLPGGVNSPVRSFQEVKISPLIAALGKGEKLVDIDGNTFIDLCCSWGALVHGHAPSPVVKAAQKRVAEGSSFGLSTEIELKMAQKVTQHIPSIDKLRFVSSGTEATMTALRLARGFTGRDYILKFSGHYHGHADSLLVQAGSGVSLLNATSSSKGVPQGVIHHTISIPFNNKEMVKNIFNEHGNKIAAVILEPVAVNMGVVPPQEGFLHLVREESAKHGALLIFDEVITGFRMGLGGAQAFYGISSDLTCLGKIIGGGFPAAAFGGKKEIMDCLAPLGGVYQAGTLSGNPVAMEAGYHSILLCEQGKFYETLEQKTKMITDPVCALIHEKKLPICIQQVGSLFTLFFAPKVTNFEEAKRCDLEKFNRFYVMMLEKGIYLSPSQFEGNFISAAHTPESLNYIAQTIVEALLNIF